MSDRTCERCGHVFQKPCLLTRHLARKTPCIPKTSRRHVCEVCGQAFSSRSALSTHRRRSCKSRSEEESTLREQLEKQSEQIRQLTEMVKSMSSQVATSQASAQVQVNFNLTINVFGGEDCSHIRGEEVKQLLDKTLSELKDPRRGALQAFLGAAALIYSDPAHPENITCYMPNKKRDEVFVRGERGWEIRPYQVVLPPMAGKTCDVIFQNQPFTESERYGDLLRALRDNEEAYKHVREMKTILVRNRDLIHAAASSGALPTKSEAAPRRAPHTEEEP